MCFFTAVKKLLGVHSKMNDWFLTFVCVCVNLKKQPLHPLQLLVDLPGKWRIRECQRETETENQRESNRDSFKAFCGCVIESWSSCACLTHWVMVGCLGSHTHTHIRTHWVQGWHTRGAPPLTFHFIILLFPFLLLHIFFAHFLEFYFFSVVLFHPPFSIYITPSTSPFQRLSKFTGPAPSYSLWAMSRYDRTRGRKTGHKWVEVIKHSRGGVLRSKMEPRSLFKVIVTTWITVSCLAK